MIRGDKFRGDLASMSRGSAVHLTGSLEQPPERMLHLKKQPYLNTPFTLQAGWADSPNRACTDGVLTVAGPSLAPPPYNIYIYTYIYMY